MIPVVWQNYDRSAPKKGYWDTGFLELLFEGNAWKPVEGYKFQEYNDISELPENTNGVVVITQARCYSDEKNIDLFNRDISRLRWVLLILTGNEESNFDWRRIKHPNIKFWIMTPNKEKDKDVDFVIGEFFRKEAISELSKYKKEFRSKLLDWYFCGQITHERRQECAKVLRKMENGEIVETSAFAEMKVPMDEYYQKMASAKVVPCPSGLATPSSFRLFEALEAGAVPIADDYCPTDKTEGYWKFLFKDLPFPVLTDYNQLENYILKVSKEYPQKNNEVFAWWQGYKRKVAYKLVEHIRELSGEEGENGIKEKITVLVSTSPVSLHPETAVIEKVIENTRAKLPNSEILIMIDGVRPEQEHLRKQYQEYIHRLLWLCNYRWKNVLPVLFKEFKHQQGITKETIKMVKTPIILFLEHDIPLVSDYDDFEWEKMSKIILSKQANIIRFHFEVSIPKEHQYLMLDKTPQNIEGIPMIRTIQWSQRPHLASTEYYKYILNTYFSKDAKTMIEDKMYGVVQTEGWDRNRLFIYTPKGDIKRAYHLGARRNEPKFEMRF